MDSRDTTASPLIQHIAAVLDHVGAQAALAAPGAEVKSINLSAIFQQPLALPPEAKAVFAEVSDHFEKQLTTLELRGAADRFMKLDLQIAALTEKFTESTAFKAYLNKNVHVDKQAAFQRRIERAYLFQVVSNLRTQNRMTSDMGNLILLAFDSNQKLMKDRIIAYEQKFPDTALIQPTICHFAGKPFPSLQFFGHVAVGILANDMPHDLVLCSKPLPLHSEDERAQYLRRLPMHARHNALLVAGEGCGLVLLQLHLDEEKDEEAFTRRVLAVAKKIAKEPANQDQPILLRQDEKMWLYRMDAATSTRVLTQLIVGEQPPAREEKIGEDDTELKLEAFISEEELRALKALPQLKQARENINDGDPRLVNVMHLVRRLHLIPSNIYYINKGIEDKVTLRRLNATPQQLDLFQKTFIAKSLGADEYIRFQAQLSREEIETIREKMLTSLPLFATYLSYGPRPVADDEEKSGENDEMQAGEGSDQEYARDLNFYGRKHKLFTMPPCRAELCDQAIQGFAKTALDHYSVLEKNCVDVTYQFMLKTKHLSKIPHGISMPSNCAKHCAGIIMLDVKKRREEIFEDPHLSRPEKIRRLLACEIRRCDALLERSTKDKQKNAARQLGLKNLLAQFQGAAESLYPAHYTALDNMRLTESGKTAEGLRDCISYFPDNAMIETQRAQRRKLLKLRDQSVDLASPPSFLSRIRKKTQRAPSAPLVTKPSSPPPAKSPTATPPAARQAWFSGAGNENSRYRYGKGDDLDLHATVKQALTEPPAKPVGILSGNQRLHVDEWRISTHVLPAVDGTSVARFGLIERHIGAEPHLNSELVAPAGDLQFSQWMLMIDRQVQECGSLLGKQPNKITVHSLDMKDLDVNHRTRELEPREWAYMGYCLAMGLTCRVMESDREVALTKDFLQKFMPSFNGERAKAKVLDARSPHSQSRETPHL